MPAPENKVGDIYIQQTEHEQRAFLHRTDGEPVFLCAISVAGYDDVSLREQFFSLATEIVVAEYHRSGIAMTLVRRDPSASLPPEARIDLSGLPCWSCTSPAAEDVRQWLRGAEQDIAGHRTPSGLPIRCCRVQVVGAM